MVAARRTYVNVRAARAVLMASVSAKDKLAVRMEPVNAARLDAPAVNVHSILEQALIF